MLDRGVFLYGVRDVALRTLRPIRLDGVPGLVAIRMGVAVLRALRLAGAVQGLDDFLFADELRDVFSREVIFDPEEELEAAVGENRLPIVLIDLLELRKRLDHEQELDPIPGDFRHGVFDGFHPVESGEFIEAHQDGVPAGRLRAVASISLSVRSTIMRSQREWVLRYRSGKERYRLTPFGLVLRSESEKLEAVKHS